MSKINIIGIGPGNSTEYLTLKALDAIKCSDIGVYVGEMIGTDIIQLFAGKETYFSDNISIAKVKSIIKIAYKQSKIIALLMPGDASIFSGQFPTQLSLGEYINWFERNAFRYEIISGITSWMVLNAKINLDMTKHASSNNIYITSISWQNESNQFDINKFEKIIASKPCIVLYQSYEKFDKIKPLLNKYYPPLTKVIFAYKLSWQDEKIVETNLCYTDNFTNNKNFSKHTLILILP